MDPKSKLQNDLFVASLETFLFSKRVRHFHEKNNKIDKVLAVQLLDLIDSISNFLKSATIEDDTTAGTDQLPLLNKIIPSIESGVLEAHRQYLCIVCKLNVKGSIEGLTDHFASSKGSKHEKNLKAYSFQSAENGSNSHSTLLKFKDKVKKERLDSAGDVIPKEISLKKAPNLPKRAQEFVLKTNLTQFVQSLIREGSALKSSYQINRICNMLEKQLVKKYPKVKVYPFGSVIVGLGSKESDLDLFIDTDDCFFNRLSKRKMKDAIFNVQRVLNSNFPAWDKFEPVIHARTPILRAFCAAEKIDCDLSFSNGLSTCNTKLVQYFLELQPICKQIVLFVKYWAHQLQLGINSYMITLMVIFYLQQEMLLPAVRSLQEFAQNNKLIIDGWNADFAPIPLHNLNIALEKDFRKYLLGFFHFYGHNFDFNNYIICTLTGTRVPKNIFDHGKENNLPPMFQRYAEYMKNVNVEEADEVEELFSNFKPMVVQDPFELIHNVSKGVNEGKLIKIITYLQLTHELLQEAKF